MTVAMALKSSGAAERADASFSFNATGTAEAYNRLLVHRFFSACADILIDRARPSAGETVLDIATGPGTVALKAAERVGSTGKVIGTDIAAGMLEIAERNARTGGSAPISWLESAAAPLKVPSGVADVVFCQHGLQYFEDQQYAMREMRRAAKPDARIVIAVWDKIEHCTVFAAMQRALSRAGLPELAESINKPFSWQGGTRALRQAIDAAGLKPNKETINPIPVRYPGGALEVFDTFWATPIGPELDKAGVKTRTAALEALKHETLSLTRPDGSVSGIMTAIVACGYCID